MELDKDTTVQQVFNLFKMNGYECYAVGGCVRDYLMGIEPKDVDFCTNATPAQMREIAKSSDITIIPTGEAFGTLTFRFEDGTQFEITTYRNDGRYEDGRHPKEVSSSTSLIDDLSRRDFTCNAIAYNPEKGIVDPFKGKEDIENGIVRCVGNAKDIFDEDALRILRLLRFALRYDFTIDTNAFVSAMMCADNIDYLSGERIGKELKEIFNYKLYLMYEDYDTIRELFDKVLRRVFPYHTIFAEDLMQITNPLARWYYVFREKVENYTTSELHRLALDSKLVNGVKNIQRALTRIRDGERIEKAVSDIKTIEEIKAFRECLNHEGFDKYEKDRFIELLVYDIPHTIEQLAITGNDVMKILKIEPGPKVREVLESCVNYVIDNPYMNTKKLLRDYVLRNEIEVSTNHRCFLETEVNECRDV